MTSLMESVGERAYALLAELVDKTPGVNLCMLVDEEGLPVCRYPKMTGNQSDKAAIAVLSLLRTAEKASGHLDLHGLKDVLVRTDTGYIYGFKVDGSIKRVFVAKTDLSIALGALLMAVHETCNLICQP